jgi:nicotinamide-nucleotide amidase
MPNAEIVAIGSELLLGQIVDTNSAWIAQRLTNLGVNLFYKTTVGDNPKRMKDTISRALGRSDVVITGGGLGPTQDDLTREIIAEVTGRKLVLDPALLDQIERRFRRRGFIMTANNERQAYIPEGAIPVHNPNGTAPSFIVEDPRGVVYALPGVPFELKWLFDNEVASYLRKRFDLSEVITYRVLKVADMGESAVDDLIGHLIASSSNPTVGVLAHPGQVDVRIAAKARSIEEASKLIAPVEEEVRRLLGRHVFAADDESMEDAVGALLRERNVTIAVYEDITGGLLAERLQQAGTSQFLEGVIGNSTASMRRLLAHSRRPDLGDDLLKEPDGLADELAWAVRAYAEADLGLALHGVPDPEDMAMNLARGRTVVSITDGKGFKTRSYNTAGRGRPDRTRMSLNAIELVRLALSEGMD